MLGWVSQQTLIRWQNYTLGAGPLQWDTGNDHDQENEDVLQPENINHRSFLTVPSSPVLGGDKFEKLLLIKDKSAG